MGLVHVSPDHVLYVAAYGHFVHRVEIRSSNGYNYVPSYRFLYALVYENINDFRSS